MSSRNNGVFSARPRCTSHALLSAIILAGTALTTSFSQAAENQAGHQRDDFSVCWSVYAGWMPWGYADTAGIVDKWADRYGINIDVRQINDYVESINQYTSGNVDGCAMTNMDALTLPAASGVDTTALIIGDYSDGNDGVLLRDSQQLEDIAGRDVNLVQFSVSHYLLARALEKANMSERDVSTVNSGDADIVALASNTSTQAVVTWNPQRSAVAAMPGWHQVFDSSQIPGEILDLMVVNTDTLAANPDFGRALVGAWYEVMGIVSEGDEQALSQMADAAGTDLNGYREQLADTHLYTTPQAALEVFESPELLATMQRIAEFSFAQGLLGDGISGSADMIGVETPSGQWGSTSNVELRFDPALTREHLESSQ